VGDGKDPINTFIVRHLEGLRIKNDPKFRATRNRVCHLEPTKGGCGDPANALTELLHFVRNDAFPVPA
jgi:hypothetical protein